MTSSFSFSFSFSRLGQPLLNKTRSVFFKTGVCHFILALPFLFPHLSGEGCEVLCQPLLLLRLLPAPDGSVPHRTSAASSRWQCSHPNLNRKLPMAVFPTGPQVQAPFPPRSQLQASLPDLNLPESMPDKTSDFISNRMSETMSDR